ncbi:MAG: TolB family protein, partial [Streptosporangiaceae bacterium]
MTRRQRIEDLTTFAVPEQPALAPDGSQIVYVLSTIDATADRKVQSLWRVGTVAGESAQLSRGLSDSAPAWSPDGSRIAFLRAQDGPAQVYVLPAAGGEPEQITTLPLGAGAPVWSPEGTKLAFAAPVDLHAAAREDDKARTSRAGEPIVADRINYQSDGAGFLRTIRSHVHVVELATKECRQQTAGDWHAEQPSWSPDSTRLAFAAGTAPDADLTFYAPVYVLDVSDPRTQPVRIGPPDVSGGRTTWTADGAAVLVVGTVGRPVGHARPLRIPLDGGDITDLAGTLDRNVLQGGPGYPGAVPQLAGDARTVLFCIRDAGCTHLYALTDGGPPRPVVAGAGHVVAGVSATGDQAAIVLATQTSFGEVVAVDLATGTQTVRTNHGACLDEVELLVREERQFTISDGTLVQGWLIR